jgi:adenine-specific DNA-methyltransferase
MANKKYKKVNLTSSDLSEERLAELNRILPEAFSEGKIDWQKLRAVLGADLEPSVERFNFTWAGKANAVKNVLIPSKATLKPAKSEGIRFDESENIFIEGDNLEVLKLLQKAYFEKVKMIYIDPPYNTGGDFVYKDNFVMPLKGYLEQTGQIDGDGNKMQTNRETNGRYHSDWLSMMYPRLKLAWNLLRDDGVIFISIDDNEVHHLRMLMDEIFGEENFVAQVCWQKKQSPQNDSTYLSSMHDYIVVYAKRTKMTRADIEGWNMSLLERTEEQEIRYSNTDNDSRGSWTSVDMTSNKNAIQRPNLYYPIKNPNTGKEIYPSRDRVWRFERRTYEKLAEENRIWWGENGNNFPRQKRFRSEVQSGIVPSTWWTREFAGDNQEAKREIRSIFSGEGDVFDTPKPTKLIERMLEISTGNDDIVLDFFAGAGVSAHAVMSINVKDGGKRKWICVQIPEPIDSNSDAYKSGYKTIADVARERIRRVIKGYGEKPKAINDGFKVFKLSASNYLENQFEFDPEKPEAENQKVFLVYLNKARQATLFSDTQTLDVVYENIIKEGLLLNSKIASEKIADALIYKVTDGDKQLMVCLDKKISSKAVKELINISYKGKLFICLDNALDDTGKANLALNIELKTI